jgi:hypothetical protein
MTQSNASALGTTMLHSARKHLEDMIEGFDAIPADELKQELMLAHSLVDVATDLVDGTKGVSNVPLLAE